MVLCGGVEPPFSSCSAGVLPLDEHHRRSGFCILRILDIFSACEVWFTFVSRTQEHRAVEDFVVKVLHDSRGSRRFTFALLPSLCFYYSILLTICQALFLIFFGGNGGACPSKSRVWAELHRLTAFPKSLAVPIPLAFVPLLYHNLGDLSRGF